MEIIGKRGRWRALASASHYVQMGIALLATVRLGHRLSVEAFRISQRWRFYYETNQPRIQ